MSPGGARRVRRGTSRSAGRSRCRSPRRPGRSRSSARAGASRPRSAGLPPAAPWLAAGRWVPLAHGARVYWQSGRLPRGRQSSSPAQAASCRRRARSAEAGRRGGAGRPSRTARAGDSRQPPPPCDRQRAARAGARPRGSMRTRWSSRRKLVSPFSAKTRWSWRREVAIEWATVGQRQVLVRVVALDHVDRVLEEGPPSDAVDWPHHDLDTDRSRRMDASSAGSLRRSSLARRGAACRFGTG